MTLGGKIKTLKNNIEAKEAKYNFDRKTVQILA